MRGLWCTASGVDFEVQVAGLSGPGGVYDVGYEKAYDARRKGGHPKMYRFQKKSIFFFKELQKIYVYIYRFL